MVKLTSEEEVKKGGRHGGGENVKSKEQQKLEESCSYFFMVVLVTKAQCCDWPSLLHNVTAATAQHIKRSRAHGADECNPMQHKQSF